MVVHYYNKIHAVSKICPENVRSYIHSPKISHWDFQKWAGTCMLRSSDIAMGAKGTESLFDYCKVFLTDTYKCIL